MNYMLCCLYFLMRVCKNGFVGVHLYVVIFACVKMSTVEISWLLQANMAYHDMALILHAILLDAT